MKTKLSEQLKLINDILAISDDKYRISFTPTIYLRFKIGNDKVYLNEETLENDEELILNPQYIPDAIKRACKVFYSAFSDNDDLLLMCDCTPTKPFKEAIPKNAGHQRIRMEKEDDEGNKYTYYRYLYKMKVSEFPAEKIFGFIVETELGGDWRYSSNIFVYNLNRNIMFKLYDDRGAFLIADKVDTLKPIYYQLNDMLLDYNRAEMDRIFTKV